MRSIGEITSALLADILPDVTTRVGRLERETAAHETQMAYEQAFEAAQLDPSIETFRAAIAAYDLMIAFRLKGPE